MLMSNDWWLIKRFGKIADNIIALEPEIEKLSNEDLGKKTAEFKERLKNGENLDDLLAESYAVAREAAYRVLGLKAYRVQLIGAVILHSGDIAEMRTGEGKTLVGLFPAYLNALTEKGVHIVTVNEYLSRRDSEINGKVYKLLNISVGLNSSNLSKKDKHFAYLQDITYTTNSELGFDYLRDNMVFNPEAKVQRELNYSIIDEADSILIDEARTPLIISGGAASKTNFYVLADKFSKTLKQEEDIEIDLESKQVFLNESGMKKAKDFFSLDNLFDLSNTEIFHVIMNALKANFAFKDGVEYTVKDNQIVLIDPFTGRIMDDRSYSDGLQQALQAKENVPIDEETMTLATITYQNFYRLYSKISGMTGTAKTEEEEFIKIYNTRVIVTPTNRPVIRQDETDYIFGSKNAALKKLIEEVKQVHEVGNPILIGTTSVESSEQVARYLDKAKLRYEMINAKNHAREADIVESAGLKKAITLSTNMAGRGTDIKLGKDVRELGGLVVFGVERNEARRVDNQLRGRSGRQGDPGRSRFFLSMEDELMIRFTSPKLRERFSKLGDDHIKSKILSRAVTNAQKKLEGLNFDQRKDVLDYDNILAQQRESIYSQRDEVLFAENLKAVIKKFQITTAYELILENSHLIRGEKTINGDVLLKAIGGKLISLNAFKVSDFNNKENMPLAREIAQEMMNFYESRIEDVPSDVVNSMERGAILNAFDHHWTKHINIASKLRSGIYLQQYAQNNPLAEYVEQATLLFDKMKIAIAKDVVDELSKVVIKEVEKPQEAQEITITDKDIDEILAETKIQKYQLNISDLEKRFLELFQQNQNDEKRLKRLQMQKNILIGLVYELERRMSESKDLTQLNFSSQQLEYMAKELGINDLNNITPVFVQECFDAELKKLSLKDKNNNEIIKRLEFVKEVLQKSAKEMSLLKNEKKSK